MPIHDWTVVPAGTFHSFHQRWIQSIGDALNTGLLPPDYFAMTETYADGPIPGVLTLKTATPAETITSGGVALLDAPPKAEVVSRSEFTAGYAARADRITVKLNQGQLVAVIEIVSRGNKDRPAALQTFAKKAHRLLRRGVHLLVVDLFPPGPHDPRGVHPAVWERFNPEPFALPPDRRLTVASYLADDEKVAYVQPVGVGQPLPDMPLFLTPDHYINCPLDATYQEAWRFFPAALKGPLVASLPTPC